MLTEAKYPELQQTDVMKETNCNSGTVQDVSPPSAKNIAYRVTHGRHVHSIGMDPSETVASLKIALEGPTEVPRGMQKLMFRGKNLADDATLLSLKIPTTGKLLLVGSKAADIAALNQRPTVSSVADSLYVLKGAANTE